MTRVLEAEARISAVDKTGGVFERIAGKINALNRAASAVTGVSGAISQVGNKVAAVGRNMALGVTLPAVAAGRAVMHSLHEFELASNKLKAFGNLSDEQLKNVREIAKRYGKDYAFGPEGVLKGMVEQIKAGFEPRHLEAIQKPLLDFATLAEIDIPKAAELAIYSLAGFGKMYDKTGKMLEASELNVNLRQMVDLFAILNKVAPGNIQGISETFKYAAAAASQLKVAPEQLGAFTAVLAQAGILGPEAGVALRSMMVRFLKPTKPALAAMSAVGMNLDNYVVKNPALLKPENVLSAVEQQTGTLSKDKRRRFLSAVGKLNGLGGEDYEKGLIAAIQGTGSGDLKDADIAGKLSTRIMGTAIEKIDIMRFLKDASAKAPNFAAFMAMFMDQRQAVRLANLDNSRVTYMLTEMEKELTAARERGTSVSADMANKINSGLVGAENQLRGSYQNLIQTLGESGMTDAAVRSMDSLASGLRNVAAINPKILELSTYAAAAAVALGPLIWVVGKLSTAGAALSRLITTIAPAAANVPIAGPIAGVIAGTEVAKLAKGALDDAYLPPHMAWREHEIRRLGDPLADPTGSPSARGIYSRDIFGATPVKAEVTGNADLQVNVKIEPSPDFWTQITTKISNAINAVRVNGAPPAGTAGSTGTAMPEAGAVP